VGDLRLFSPLPSPQTGARARHGRCRAAGQPSLCCLLPAQPSVIVAGFVLVCHPPSNPRTPRSPAG